MMPNPLAPSLDLRLLSAWLIVAAGTVSAVELPAKEVSLVTGQPIGELAVAGRLSVDLHAEFMASRSYGTENVLNWFNCGYSGGGGGTPGVGGTFGDFGMHFPEDQRADRYPHWDPLGEVPAIRFDGNDILMGNFPVEPAMAGDGDGSLEVWLRMPSANPGGVVLGWQSPDGSGTSAPLVLPMALKPSDSWRHLVVVTRGDREALWLDGQRVSGAKRESRIVAGQRLVLGGAAASKPSFRGSIAAVRLHDAAMDEREIAYNHRGGPMLGTKLHAWWRIDDGPWRVEESKHFRHCVEKERIAKWDDKQKREFEERLPGMFQLAELIHHTYTQRLALRGSLVSRRPEKRGDGIKYKTPIQPSDGGSYMGVDDDFGWGCQFAGFINPHELVHGFQAQTGGMQGNFWETHANFPQTYNGVYQTMPMVFAEGPCVPSSGRTYYHDRLMLEHLAQTPEYGPMFISKMWYDGPAASGLKDPYPWQVFPKLDPDPSTPLEYEYVRMVQRMVTWDITTFAEAKPGEGNTPNGNDGVPSAVSRYREVAAAQRPDMLRFGRVVLEPHPLAKSTWCVPRHQAPQQLGWNICPLECKPGKVFAQLEGLANPARGGAWHAAFVSVDANGKPTYGEVLPAGRRISFTVGPDARELYLVVAATPGKIMPINMTGDFRSFEQEPFPYQVKLAGTAPVNPLDAEPVPPAEGAPHPNGGGFVARTAEVAATAYVGPDARVTGISKVLDQARIDGRAEVRDSTVSGRAVVTGRALVMENSTVTGDAIVADHAVVRRKSIVTDHARVLEHANINSGGTCGGHVTVKGLANVYGGNQSGTAMIDGFYAKGNEITGGRWLTWSWGKGKNPGETDADIGPDILKLDFEEPHPWMARDEVGVTWGTLVGAPKFEIDPAIERIRDTLHEPPGVIQQLQDGAIEPTSHAVAYVGYLLPPATGDYTFWIAADDEGELRLGQPGGGQPLEVLCSNPFFASAQPPQFDKFPSQKSKPLRLEKGRAYPILAIKTNAHMASGISVAWTRPGGSAPEIISAPHLSVTADGKQPGVSRRIWSDVSSLVELTKRADFPSGKMRESGGVLVLDGSSHVELPRDPTLLREMVISTRIRWAGRDGEKLFEASGKAGEQMCFTPSENGKARFVISHHGATCEVTAPPVPQNTWTDITITLRAGQASLDMTGQATSARPCKTTPLDLDATSFLLGRGLRGDFFTGKIEHFTLSHPQ